MTTWHRIGRIMGPTALVLVCTATSCITDTGIVVELDPLVPVDTAASVAMALTERLARRRGLTHVVLVSPPSDTAWGICAETPEKPEDSKFGTQVLLCGHLKVREIQFHLTEVMARGFTPHTDSLRLEMLDSLRARFGEPAVRECQWEDKWEGCRPRGTGKERALPES